MRAGEILLTIALGAVGSVIAAEFCGWAPTIAEWLVRRHAARFKIPLGERLLEEWRADLGVLPGGLAKLWFAFDLYRARWRIARDVPGSVAMTDQMPRVLVRLREIFAVLRVDDSRSTLRTRAILAISITLSSSLIHSLDPVLRLFDWISDVMMLQIPSWATTPLGLIIVGIAVFVVLSTRLGDYLYNFWREIEERVASALPAPPTGKRRKPSK